MLFSVPCLGDMRSVKTKSNSSSQDFAGLNEGEYCFSISPDLGGILDSFCFSAFGFSTTGDDISTGSLLSSTGSSGLLVLDKGMFVKWPESILSDAEDVRCDDFRGGERLSLLSLLSGDLAFLDDDFLLGDLSGVTFLLFPGECERLRGDLLFLRSEDAPLYLRGDRLLVTFLFLDGGESFLLLEVDECLSSLSFRLLDGEALLLGVLLLDFKSLLLFFVEHLLLFDRLLDLLDRSL